MATNRTRKIVVTGILGAITIFLGVTHWGLIPWFSGASLTIMHIPVIIGAIIEGPIVGGIIGLIFGVFSLIQAAVAPTGPSDILFTNPLISILPRLFIGPVAWLVWKALEKLPALGMILSGLAGSLTNTVLVLGMIGILGQAPWELIWSIVIANGLPEAGVSALIVLAVVAAWKRIEVGRKGGAKL